MFRPKTPAALLDAGILEEVGPRTYDGALARYAFLRIGGEVYAPVSASRRVDGHLNEPGVSDVSILCWSGPTFVTSLRKPNGALVEDLAEILRRCQLFRIGRLLTTLALAVFPGLLLTPLGMAVIAGYGVARFWKRGTQLNEVAAASNEVRGYERDVP